MHHLWGRVVLTHIPCMHVIISGKQIPTILNPRIAFILNHRLSSKRVVPFHTCIHGVPGCLSPLSFFPQDFIHSGQSCIWLTEGGGISFDFTFSSLFVNLSSSWFINIWIAGISRLRLISFVHFSVRDVSFFCWVYRLLESSGPSVGSVDIWGWTVLGCGGHPGPCGMFLTPLASTH